MLKMSQRTGLMQLSDEHIITSKVQIRLEQD